MMDCSRNFVHYHTSLSLLGENWDGKPRNAVPKDLYLFAKRLELEGPTKLGHSFRLSCSKTSAVAILLPFEPFV